jgi:hypothetical protein
MQTEWIRKGRESDTKIEYTDRSDILRFSNVFDCDIVYTSETHSNKPKL